MGEPTAPSTYVLLLPALFWESEELHDSPCLLGWGDEMPGSLTRGW